MRRAVLRHSARIGLFLIAGWVYARFLCLHESNDFGTSAGLQVGLWLAGFFYSPVFIYKLVQFAASTSSQQKDSVLPPQPSSRMVTVSRAMSRVILLVAGLSIYWLLFVGPGFSSQGFVIAIVICLSLSLLFLIPAAICPILSEDSPVGKELEANVGEIADSTLSSDQSNGKL